MILGLKNSTCMKNLLLRMVKTCKFLTLGFFTSILIAFKICMNINLLDPGTTWYSWYSSGSPLMSYFSKPLLITSRVRSADDIYEKKLEMRTRKMLKLSSLLSPFFIIIFYLFQSPALVFISHFSFFQNDAFQYTFFPSLIVWTFL